MENEKICRTCNESKPLTEYRGGRTQCKQCDTEHIGNLSRERIAERNKAIKKEFEAGKNLHTLSLEYGLTLISIYQIVHKGRTKPDSRKELKAKLNEFLQSSNEPLKITPEPIYPIPVKQRVTQIAEVKTYSIKDLPEAEQQRINAMFKPYVNSSGKTVQR